MSWEGPVQHVGGSEPAATALHLLKAWCVAGMVVVHGLYWAVSKGGLLVFEAGTARFEIVSRMMFLGYLPLLLPFTAGAALRFAEQARGASSRRLTWLAPLSEAAFLVLCGILLNVVLVGTVIADAWNVLHFVAVAMLLLLGFRRLFGGTMSSLVVLEVVLLLGCWWASTVAVEVSSPAWQRILLGDPTDYHTWAVLPWLPTFVGGWLAAELVLRPVAWRRRVAGLAAGGGALSLLSAALGGLAMPFDPQHLIGPAMMIPGPGRVIGVLGVGLLGLAVCSLAAPGLRLRSRGLAVTLSRGILWAYLAHMVLGMRAIGLVRQSVPLEILVRETSTLEAGLWVVSFPAFLLVVAWAAARISLWFLDRRLAVTLRSKPTVAPSATGAGEDDRIAVVGIGCVLPDAENPEALWRLATSGATALRPLPTERWPQALHYHPDGENETSLSTIAGVVDDRTIEAAAARLGLSRTEHDRLTVMALEAVSQAVEHIPAQHLRDSRTALLLGCMDLDEDAVTAGLRWECQASIESALAAADGSHHEQWSRAVLDQVEAWSETGERFRRHRMPSSVLALIRRRFGIGGPSGLVDAACASSLATVAIGARALVDHEVDLAVVGGIESALGPETFSLFTGVGALAPGSCRPLHPDSQGLSQGEGAVALVLERVGDARRHGHQLLAVLDGVGMSSDGHSTSLFAPNSTGQEAAMAAAWHGLDRKTAAYIECHATGTEVGDRTEIASVASFFAGQAVAVGSFKAVIGHTKATAGAASLLRAVLALNHGEMPPMPGEHPPPVTEAGAPVILDRALALADPKQRIGVSSFGFGGINVHVVLASAEAVHREASNSLGKRPQTAGILVGTAIRRIDDSLRTDPVLDQLRVAPATRPQIDEAQLAALVAVQGVLDKIGLDLERVAPDKVAVVSASVTALGAATRLGHRMRYRELAALVPAEVESVRKALARSRDELAPLTEDSGPGILNNVIAGRVANTFNLTGPSFNVDADLASAGLAHWVATNLLGPSCRLVLLIDVHERWNSDKNRVERDSVEVKLLATEEATWEFGLPRLRLLAEVEHVA